MILFILKSYVSRYVHRKRKISEICTDILAIVRQNYCLGF